MYDFDLPKEFREGHLLVSTTEPYGMLIGPL